MNIETLYKIFTENPSIQTDTRKLQKGDIYFALKGENFDGNTFAGRALEKGASFVVVDDRTYKGREKHILVDNVLNTLQQLASHHRDQFDIPVIAITGSNGKTTTKEIIHSILNKKYKTIATVGNLNNHIGVPLTLLQLKDDTEMLVVEMGANHVGEIASYCQWAKPNYAIVNNCGKAHLEGFGSYEGVRKAKGELYDYIRMTGGTIFINSDLDYLKKMSRGIEKQITYGEYEGKIRGKAVSDESFLNVILLTAGMETSIHTNLYGRYNLPNILAGICVGNYFGIALDMIKEAVEHYVPTNNRSEIRVLEGIKIILDAYNANPTSMETSIKNFAEDNSESKIIMLGDMMELGDMTDVEHQRVVNTLNGYQWKHVVLVGTYFGKTKNRFQCFENSLEASVWFKQMVHRGDFVLIKGSRLTAMEKIIE